MIADADDGLNQMSSPNFYGYVLGGSHPVGVAADMLVSAWGQNVGSSMETPAITGMERAVCDWVIDLLGLPADVVQSTDGLLRVATFERSEGVPGLSSLPLVGKLFAFNKDEIKKNELVIFLRPTIVRGGGTDSLASNRAPGGLWENSQLLADQLVVEVAPGAFGSDQATATEAGQVVRQVRP